MQDNYDLWQTKRSADLSESCDEFVPVPTGLAFLLLDLTCREPRRVAEVSRCAYSISGRQPGLVVDRQIQQPGDINSSTTCLVARGSAYCTATTGHRRSSV